MTKLTYAIGDCLLITWHDSFMATTEFYWVTSDDLDYTDIEPMSSIGFFIKSDDIFLTIAQCLMDGKEGTTFGGVFSVPLSTIVEVSLLKN